MEWKNWLLVSNFDFLSLQPDDLDLRYIKLDSIID